MAEIEKSNPNKTVIKTAGKVATLGAAIILSAGSAGCDLLGYNRIMRVQPGEFKEDIALSGGIYGTIQSKPGSSLSKSCITEVYISPSHGKFPILSTEQEKQLDMEKGRVGAACYDMIRRNKEQPSPLPEGFVDY